MSSDGGDTWAPLAHDALGGCNIVALAMRGPIIPAGANQRGGLYRGTDTTDDLLLAGTLGRGAWTLSAASRVVE